MTVEPASQDNPAPAAENARDRQPRPHVAFGCGLAMGTADAVPGVSGGTIALILGIYEAFIAALADVVGVLRHPLEADSWRRLAYRLRFLVPLGLGVVIALITALKLLVGDKPTADDAESLRAALANADGLLLNPSSAPIVFAAFFGLVLASISEPWCRRIDRRGIDWLLALAGAALAAGLSLSPAGTGSTAVPMLILAGAIAISVMLLPGISGSLALLIIGMYQPIASAVHDREIVTVAWFLLGMTLGGAAFIPCLRWLLRRCHDRTMAFLSGLMAGSLVALWPWKSHYFPEGIPLLGPLGLRAPSGSWWWPLIAVAIGAGCVILAGKLARQRAP